MHFLKQLYCRTFQLCLKVALPFLPYREPLVLENTLQIVQVLQEKAIDGVLLVVDKNIRQLKLSQPLEHALAAGGIACYIYDETVQNPTITNVLQAKQVYTAHGCGAIIGFGGGSPIDCAKCVGACLARPHLPIAKMHGILKILKRTPLFFAVPTTAGTGSEVTLTSVITDEETKRKYTINDFPLIPDYAVLDYRLTLGLPKQMTSTTGLDALTHAVEAYIGRSTSKYTRALAEEAIVRIHQSLWVAYTQPQNVEARKSMQLAAYKAGIAFSQSYVGYVHALSHAISGRYHTPHGLANACILPYFLEEYGQAIDPKLAHLAQLLSLCPDAAASTKEKADAFRAWVWAMNAQLEIPTTLPEIQENDMPQIVAYAEKEANPLYPVPVLMGKEELTTMLRKVMA